MKKKTASRPGLEKIRAKAERLAIPFISFLLEEKIISQTALQQVLFDLFGIPLKPVSDIIFDQTCRNDLTSVIDGALAEKLGMIPLHLSDSIMTIGLTDPDSLVFIRKLDLEFPQYRFVPVFIPFSGFKWFYPVLYPKTQATFTPPKFIQHQPAAKDAQNSARPETVRDPNQDEHVIARLFRQYETLRLGHEPRNNHGSNNYRQPLFAQFIRDSYYEIAAPKQLQHHSIFCMGTKRPGHGYREAQR